MCMCNVMQASNFPLLYNNEEQDLFTVSLCFMRLITFDVQIIRGGIRRCCTVVYFMV